MHSLFNLGAPIQNEPKLTKKRGRKTKPPEDSKPKVVPEIKDTPKKRSKHKESTESRVPQTVSQPTVNPPEDKWFRTPDKVPEELRPIEFHTQYKKPIMGYRQGYGYITDTPYFIDKFKQQNGYIEWRYINYCTTLSKCPKEFPMCNSCKNNRR